MARHPRLTVLRQFFLVLAVIGFLFSLMVHILALSGHAPSSDVWIAVLFGGCLVLWIIAAYLSGAKAARLAAIPVNEIVKRCPTWLKRSYYLLLLYSSLLLLFELLRHSGIFHVRPTPEPSAETFVFFSGFSMTFYMGAFAMLFGKLRAVVTPE